jgi:LmbE family N-acetylglucosaminyl deacetylase
MLACLAHPDDETFGMGGTLALYARRGVQIYLVCGTRGDVGEMDPQLMGFNSVAERANRSCVVPPDPRSYGV